MRRLALLFLSLIAACSGEKPARTYGKAPVILISIDTLRADHLPMYGYRALAAPNLDALRRDSILFRNAYSHVPLTLPSHVSLLTGRLPQEHGVRNNLGYVLDPAMPTLPKALKTRGYDTGAAVSAYVLRGSTGLGPSFDFYEDAISNRASEAVGQVQRAGERTAAVAEAWIAPRATKPFFFMLHLFEPHAPYEPTYDADIAAADRVVGSFLQSLKRLGIYDRAIVILLSDHGEGLNDHGEPEHGIFVYREAIHVPLLVKLPSRDRAGETIDDPVGLVDVFPTVAQLVGATVPANLSGASLLGPRDPERRIYAESIYPRIHLGWSELRSLIGIRHHFISAPRPELFDVARDPAERTNIVSSERRVYAALREELRGYDAAIAAPARITAEEARKLAALGYLSSSSAEPEGPLPDPKDRIGEIGAMVRASELLRKRDYVRAAAAFREMVETNPRLTDAWNQLGAALEAAGRYEEASEVYATVIRTSPSLAADFGLRQASVLLRLERYDEAEKHAALAESTNPAGMHLMLARVAMARKDFSRAEAEARAAAADPGDRNAAELLIAQVWTQQGMLEEALQLVQRIGNRLEAEGIPSPERFHFVRGDIFGRMERYDDAIAEFRREIAAFPDSRQTYANLYLVLMVLDRRREAEAVLEEMVRANPGKASMLFAARTAAALGEERGAARWRARASGER